LCNNPFGGPAARLFAAAGFSPSRKKAPRRTLDLRGHEQPINAFALGTWSDNQRRKVVGSSA
jgi:hypothetical protein